MERELQGVDLDAYYTFIQNDDRIILQGKSIRRIYRWEWRTKLSGFGKLKS